MPLIYSPSPEYPDACSREKTRRTAPKLDRAKAGKATAQFHFDIPQLAPGRVIKICIYLKKQGEIAMGETDIRKMTRFDLELTAYLSVGDNGEKNKSIELMTSNICAGGAYFLTDIPMSRGTEVKMDLILELDRLHEFGGRQSHIHISGSVIRTDQQGMAVCFDRKYKISLH